MKKLAIFTILTLFFLLMGLDKEILAQPQKTKSPAKVKAEVKFADTPIWYVHYNLLITGNGGKAFSNGTGDGQSITWTIKRMYSGDFKVELEQQSKQAAQAAKAMQKIKLPPGVTLPSEAQQVIGKLADQDDGILWIDPLTAPPLAAFAEINDERTSVFVDRGGEAGVGKCRETKTENWTFGGQVKRAGSYASFNARPEADTARIVFGFAPTASVGNIPVKFSTRVEGNCSQNGDENNTQIKEIEVSDIGIPEFENLIVGQGVNLDFPKATLSYEGDGWQFTSDRMPVKAEIGGFPESKGEVAAILYIKFSKSPPPPNTK